MGRLGERPVIFEPRTRFGLVALLLIGPVLALAAVDRAIVHSDAHWQWVAREVPPQLLDPYRVEALLRATAPGGALILGNSTAEEAFDSEALERSFSDRGLHFEKLTIGGSNMVTFGMLAEAVAELEPAVVIVMVSSGAVRADGYQDRVHAYDVRAVPHIFTAAEVLGQPGMHLRGLLRQSHVLARHRRAMQQVVLIELGWSAWWRVRLAIRRYQLAMMMSRGRMQQFFAHFRKPEVFPNPNTRALEFLARRAREAGAHVLLVEAPRQPILRLALREHRQQQFRDYMAALAATGGFEFVSMAEFPEFEIEDFKDMIHMSERGRAKFTERFTPILRENL